MVPGNRGHINDFENDEWIGIVESKTEPFSAPGDSGSLVYCSEDGLYVPLRIRTPWVSQSQDLGVQFSYHWKRFALSQRVWSSHSCICYLFLSFFILITAQSLLFHISANPAFLISAITTINKHHMFNYLKTSYKRKESDK